MNGKNVLPLFLALLMLTSCGNSQDNTLKAAAQTAAETVCEMTSEAADNIQHCSETAEEISMQPSSETVTETENTEETTDTEKTTDTAAETTDKNSEEQNEGGVNEEFADSVYIIGDSIALGYGAYQRVPSKHVFAKLNVAPSSIRDFTFDYNGSEKEILTILSKEMPGSIMISMGVNDIITYSSEDFADKYMDFVRDVRKLCPDADIYIMALTPVMKSCEYTDNNAISGYNKALKSAVEAEKDDAVIFIDAPNELSDKSGYLKSEYSGGDGMHLSGSAYDVLLENISSYVK